MPEVGIVIPAFNSSKFIGDAIDSVRSQSFTDFVCFVIDDGSSDDTVEVAKQHASDDARIHVVALSHGGISEARNAGLAMVPDEVSYVAFPDSDDIWEPNALEVLKAALESRPGLVGAHGLATMIDSEGLNFGKDDWTSYCRDRARCRDGRRLEPTPLGEVTRFENLLYEFTIYPAGVSMFRRDACVSSGGYDPRYTIGEDLDLLLRLTRVGDLAFADETIVRYRQHDDQVSGDKNLPDSWTPLKAVVDRTMRLSLKGEAGRAVRTAWRYEKRRNLREHSAQMKTAVSQRKPAAVAVEGAALLLNGFRWSFGPPSKLTTSVKSRVARVRAT